MKKPILLFLLLLISLHVHPRQRNHPIITIGPAGGVIASFVSFDSGEAMFKYGYSYGGRMHIRPIEQLSFTTGFSYNKIIDTSTFYDVPAVINYTTKNSLTLSLGPVFFFDAYEGRFNTKEKKVGFAAGIQRHSFGIYFLRIPTQLVFKETTDKVTGFIGLYMSMEIQFGII